MEFVWGIIGAVLGIVGTTLFFRRKSPAPVPAQPLTLAERELNSVLDEIRELRAEMDILKTNPTIGEAVRAALEHDYQQSNLTPGAYDVAVSPVKLPASAYDVLVTPNPLPDSGER